MHKQSSHINLDDLLCCYCENWPRGLLQQCAMSSWKRCWNLSASHSHGSLVHTASYNFVYWSSGNYWHIDKYRSSKCWYRLFSAMNQDFFSIFMNLRHVCEPNVLKAKAICCNVEGCFKMCLLLDPGNLLIKYILLTYIKVYSLTRIWWETHDKQNHSGSPHDVAHTRDRFGITEIFFHYGHNG